MLDVSIGFTFDKEQVAGEFEGKKYDYKQTNIFLDHLAAPIPAGRCPGPICGIGYDSTAVRIDAVVMDACPVCSHMSQVGWAEAGKRLYAAYGSDILEVIDTGYIPAPPKLETSIDAEFSRVLAEFNSNIEKPRNAKLS